MRIGTKLCCAVVRIETHPRNKVLDQKYAALLAGRCKEAEVMTNHEVLNSIAFP